MSQIHAIIAIKKKTTTKQQTKEAQWIILPCMKSDVNELTVGLTYVGPTRLHMRVLIADSCSDEENNKRKVLHCRAMPGSSSLGRKGST